MYLRAELTRVCVCQCAETATLSRYSNDVRTDLQTGSDLTWLLSVTIGIPLSRTRYFSILTPRILPPIARCTFGRKYETPVLLRGDVRRGGAIYTPVEYPRTYELWNR